MSAAGGALEGIRAIELSDERIAFAGKLLGDMGAEVIAVEPPGGQRMRSYPPFRDDRPDAERSLYWWHYNTSKFGVTLDWTRPQGRELLRRLVSEADLLIESEEPGTLDQLGLGYAELSALNPRLVMVSMTPFGQRGPRSEERATDLTLLAGGGPAWSCGYDDHSLPPVRGGGNQAYQTGCHFAVISALVALLARDETGRGQFIDVNLHAAANVTTEAGSYHYLVSGEIVQRQTGRHAGSRPSPPMQRRCADGRYVNTGVGLRRPADFAALCEWLESAGLDRSFGKMPALRDAAGREKLDAMRAARDPAIAEMLAAGREAIDHLADHLSAYDFFVGGQERGIPVGAVYSPEEALEDPHHRARGIQVSVEHPELGRSFDYPGAPYLFSGTPWRIQRRAPRLGEHNQSVYAELGVSPAELSELRAAGVV
ncbi:MAG: CoA transferase [Proteobacteria bacterium]|nr:CoA transferase [Pseudomonadota bacterium]